MASTAKSFLETLKRYIKAPWAYTGPQASPHYKSPLPKATEYRVHCPASTPQRAVVPSCEPEHVYDIKYYTRDPLNKRVPVERIFINKADSERLAREVQFDIKDFPQPYVPTLVKERFDVDGDGYEDGLPKKVDRGRYKVVDITFW